MSANLMEKWDKIAEDMMLNFAESGHPTFRATNALERGELKSKGKGVKFRTVISVSQLSVYGAVADLCGELARDSRGTEKPSATGIWNQWFYPQNFLLLTQFLRLMPK